MDQVAMTVLKTSRKVRGNKARVVTSHLAYLLMSEVMPAPLLSCQCFRVQTSSFPEQQTVAEIHCLHHLSGIEYVWRRQMWSRAKQEWQWGQGQLLLRWEFVWFLHCDTPRDGWHQGEMLSCHHQVEFWLPKTTYVGGIMFWIQKNSYGNIQLMRRSPSSASSHNVHTRWVFTSCLLLLESVSSSQSCETAERERKNKGERPEVMPILP